MSKKAASATTLQDDGAGELITHDDGLFIEPPDDILPVGDDEGEEEAQDTPGEVSGEEGEDKPTEAPAPATPELIGGKFKSTEALLDAYQHSEKELHSRSQALAEKERLIDEYLLKSLQPQQPKDAEPEFDFGELENLGVDTKGLKAGIDAIVTARTKELQDKLKQIETVTASSSFDQAVIRQHPDVFEVTSEPGFRDFMSASIPKGVRDKAQEDPDTANWILTQYKERRNGKAQQPPAAKPPDNKAPLEPGKSKPFHTEAGKGQPEGKKIYSRAELARLSVEDREAYREMNDEILQAYAEGRVR